VQLLNAFQVEPDQAKRFSFQASSQIRAPVSLPIGVITPSAKKVDAFLLNHLGA